MSDSTPFVILDQPCNNAIEWVTRQFSSAGLQVVRTFDLHVARHAQINCQCPHHGTDQCDCQMVVLLIYGSGGYTSSECQPVSVVAHGHNGQTWFSLVNTLQQRADPRLEAAIRQALVPHSTAILLHQESQSHATGDTV